MPEGCNKPGKEAVLCGEPSPRPLNFYNSKEGKPLNLVLTSLPILRHIYDNKKFCLTHTSVIVGVFELI